MPSASKHRGRTAAANLSKEEGDEIAMMFVRIVVEVAERVKHARSIERSGNEPTGLGYLGPDVSEHVYKRSA